ncbi:carboxypeptidase-like regulatory domain-containing protein [Hymenobacter lutimineralis]|uniref:Carboxypeptidase-like regulatory domain-containing protein n=1 Tax=Hymenobacter lutimineralis TaxID=2606448 RepID=A0A5D6V201_9BACT|nr:MULTISPECIES: carboxypeptidase-like regulatory domain-containing protein [Hymenobacter]QIX62201.1 carboxypeptidase-like regulatory domain-containing protein [Hymenobacter sp. BT18]TYZ10081.1 carboxypeptidase-like regulatory domain-containing protein [Hymenobacter lutimineralis]
MSEVVRFRFIFVGLLLLAAWLGGPTEARAQGQRQVVQFTGIVATGDSLLGVPGASVLVPQAGRGTATNAYGYFSLPVLAGDSIVIRSLGYRNQYVVIPADYARQSYSVIVSLKEDATVLPEIRIFPYATEREFKRAFLALKLPKERGSATAENLNEDIMRRIFNNAPVTSVGNYRQTLQQQQLEQQRRMGMGPSLQSNNPLLNPFSWLQLIQQVKKGEFKKKEGVDY